MCTIAVVGAGTMGVDLAIMLSSRGYHVILKDIDPKVLEQTAYMLKSKIREYRMFSSEFKNWNTDEILSRIKITDEYTGFEEALWIIENIDEDIDSKEKLYRELCIHCREDAFYAANTSCISATKIASFIPKPQNLVAMHFMNPVPIKEVVEVVRGVHSSDEIIEKANSLIKSLGKISVVVQDSPGFVVNRLSHLFMNEAAFLVQEAVAQPEKIDELFRLGYGHKMGPLETADLIGLDTVLKSLNVLYQSFRDPKFRACTLLVKMVDAGLLGRKSGKGFYTYR